jgi:2-keto-3-deoxy-6-phosphogluconate aldolase
VLTGGYGGSAGERVVTTELRVLPTDSVGGLDLVATLARMFHQSLLYGPGGASDRAIWAFLMV